MSDEKTTTETSADFAQLLLQALSAQAEATNPGGEEFDETRHVVLGEVPEHLRHLWLLKNNLVDQVRAREAELARTMLHMKLAGVIFSESLKAHVDIEGFEGDVAMGSDWRVLGEKETEDDFEGMNILGSLLEAVFGGRGRPTH
jgi:hypothetical protein